MKAIGIPLFLLVLAVGVAAQEDPTNDKATIKYHEWRSRITEPTYGLKKVKSLIKHLKGRPADETEANIALPAKTFAKLSFKEKFTYNMIYGEYHTQNCDVFMAVRDEQKNIYAHVPEGFEDDNYWSDGQRAWFKANRAKVIPLLREVMRKDAGSNVKVAILEAGAFELIPDLIKRFRVEPKDKDLLTTLNCLMNDGKYEPFMKSQTFEKLYSEKALYRSSIAANKANEDLIVKRAMDYYNSKKRH